METEEQVALKLLQIKAIKLSPQSPFTWASGKKSPIYCDNRKSLSYPYVRDYIRDALVEKAKDFGTITMVAGVATAGIAHGVLLANALGLPFVYIRSKAKGHGLQNLIEGELKGNERVLVVEDLISTGGSALSAVQVIESAGCQIAGVLAIFTYGFPLAVEAFEKADCRLETLSNFEVLLKESVRIGYINEEELKLIEQWREDF